MTPVFSDTDTSFVSSQFPCFVKELYGRNSDILVLVTVTYVAWMLYMDVKIRNLWQIMWNNLTLEVIQGPLMCLVPWTPHILHHQNSMQCILLYGLFRNKFEGEHDKVSRSHNQSWIEKKMWWATPNLWCVAFLLKWVAVFHVIPSPGSITDTKLMMTSSIGNIFRVTGLLCGEFTGNRWIPLTKASDAELWCFLGSAPE